MRSELRFTLFVPTLNEIDGCRAIMPQVPRHLFHEILVIDGHSTDGTQEYMRSIGCRVVEQDEPGGQPAFWQGFSMATGDVIVSFSPDGNSLPSKLPTLVSKMREGYDMVIVSRYKEDAKSEDDSWLSALANRFFTRAINLLFGARYTDSLVMYRAIRKDLLQRINVHSGTGRPFNRNRISLFEIILSIRCAQNKLKVDEIPGDEPNNIGRKDSRAHPGNTKYYNGMLMIYHLARELLLRPGQAPRTADVEAVTARAAE